MIESEKNNNYTAKPKSEVACFFYWDQEFEQDGLFSANKDNNKIKQTDKQINKLKTKDYKSTHSLIELNFNK